MVKIVRPASSLSINVNYGTLRSLITVTVISILAVCLNPFGPITLLYPFKTVGIGALQDYIQEWQSPNFHSISVQPFAWLLLLDMSVAALHTHGHAVHQPLHTRRPPADLVEVELVEGEPGDRREGFVAGLAEGVAGTLVIVSVTTLEVTLPYALAMTHL